jgi:hypothetical protein
MKCVAILGLLAACTAVALAGRVENDLEDMEIFPSRTAHRVERAVSSKDERCNEKCGTYTIGGFKWVGHCRPPYSYADDEHCPDGGMCRCCVVGRW